MIRFILRLKFGISQVRYVAIIPGNIRKVPHPLRYKAVIDIAHSLPLGLSFTSTLPCIGNCRVVLIVDLFVQITLNIVNLDYMIICLQHKHGFNSCGCQPLMRV